MRNRLVVVPFVYDANIFRIQLNLNQGTILKSGKFATFSRRALNAALASALVLGGSGLAVNAYAASANGTASATVVIPIAIAAVTALNFGSFSTATAGDTVTIAASGGTRTNSGTLPVNSVNAPT